MILQCVYFIINQSTSLRTGQYYFLCTGADRKVDHITEEEAKNVEKYNILLIQPEYSERLFPKIESYQYGNVRTKPKELWTYYVNDRIFKLVKKITGSQQKQYYIWGNSAGAQFVHRQIIVGAYKFINLVIHKAKVTLRYALKILTICQKSRFEVKLQHIQQFRPLSL